ncbi:MAG: hypothetical protein K0B05_11135 [Bacteroidales bacterium]|nr:hypothetical protein [Bacteroidales bacterium]
MSSLIEGYNYDIFISYRQKDNKYDGWVTEFVDNLKKELEATFKEDISVYFDINPHDGLLESHEVSDSLSDKLKCLIFIPVISRTYCDPNSFAWQNEFTKFVELASDDRFGMKIKLPGGNVASRVLPIRIYDLNKEDIGLCESLLGGTLRGIEFIYKSAGVNRPLRANEDHAHENLNKTYYRDQINKVAYSIQDIISGIKDASEYPLVTRTPEEPIVEIKERINTGRNKSISKPFPRKKILIGLSLLLLLVLFSVFWLMLKRPDSSDIIQKAISNADPFNRWPVFEGKIRLRCVFASGAESDELIEINRSIDSYKRSLFSKNLTDIIGFEDGKYFHEIWNNENNTLLRSFNEDSIDCEEIDLWKQHQTALHFGGLLLELENSGLKMNKNARRVKFQGNRCYSVEFKSDSALNLNNYFRNTNWTLFLDRKDYSIKGGRMENMKLAGHTFNVFSVSSGKLIFDRLTIPMCKVNFLTLHNSLFDIEIITSPE